MDEDLGQKLRAVEGDRPSPEFVATLRRRVLAEATTPPSADAIEPITEFDVDAQPHVHAESRTRWPRAAVTMAAAAAVVAALAFGGIRWLTTSEPTPETNVATITTDPDPTSRDEAAVFVPDATRLGDRAFAEEGTYRVDALGTPFSFRVDDPLFVLPYSDGATVFEHQSSSGPDDRDLVMMRLSALADPNRLREPFARLDDGWPPDDLDGWLDALPDGLVVAGPEEVMLGGLAATRLDLAPDENSCEPQPDWCVGFGTNRLTYSKSLKAGAIYRIWVVDQRDEEPLAVIAGIEGPDDRSWFDTVEDLMATLAFGAIAPNPITTAPPGRTELPLLGGIGIELSQETVVSQVLEGFGRIPHGTLSADTTFVTNPRRADGDILATSEEFLALLRERGSTVTELDATTVGGIDAQVVDVVGDDLYFPAILRTPDDLDGWFPPIRGRLWLIDHPDRGLLMIEARSSDTDEATFTSVLAATEQMIGSLAFVERR